MFAASAARRRFAMPPKLALVDRLLFWAEISRERRALARLDTAQLRDLGLSTKDAQSEAARPFWDV